MKHSNRRYKIYVTRLRFCQRNFCYPKTQCMAIDILNSGVVDDEFINFVEEKENILFEIITEFRKARVW